MSAKAKLSAPVPAASGKRSESATRARNRAPPSARGDASASEVARVTKVAASPSWSAVRTRRPKSRFSGPGGNAPASFEKRGHGHWP